MDLRLVRLKCDDLGSSRGDELWLSAGNRRRGPITLRTQGQEETIPDGDEPMPFVGGLRLQLDGGLLGLGDVGEQLGWASSDVSIADQIRASATHTFSLHWSNTLDARYTISYEVTASQSSPRPADGQTAVAAPTGTTGHICVLPRVRQAADQVRQKLEAALSGGLRQAQQKQRLLEEIAAISEPAGDYAGYDRWFRAVVPPRSSSFAAFSTPSLLQGELTLARAQVANLLFPVGQAAATLKGLLENQCLADLANDDRLMTWARQSVYGTVRRINRKTDAQDETPQLEM